MPGKLTAIVAFCTLAAVSPLAAQPVGGPSVPVAKEPVRPQPPPALPGSRAEPDAVAPATRSAADMSPTDALFDAINRGDVAAARDAISRGADLSARNVLGLTPLDLSVDLGRNDLSFLLLSLREASGPAPGSAAATRQDSAALVAPRRPAPRVVRGAARPPAGLSGPRLFAGDGGQPIPQAGFLGFDPQR